MKGITGHRVLDAYANAALTPVKHVRHQGQHAANEGGSRPKQEAAASVQISDGARRLAQGQASDPKRIESLQEKVALGPQAFSPGVVATRLVGELAG